MELTIKDWLTLIPDPVVRDKALRNRLSTGHNSIRRCLSDALLYGFSWKESPEGFNYWMEIYEDQQKEDHDEKDLFSFFSEQLLELFEKDLTNKK